MCRNTLKNHLKENIRKYLNLKVVMLLTLIGFSFNLFSQNKLKGTYWNFLNAKLVLNADSTFFYEAPECYHWMRSVGNWTTKNDTLLLTTTNKAGTDSVISVDSSKIDLDGIRIKLIDKDSLLGYFVPMKAYSNGEIIEENTDTLGFVNFNLSKIDSIKVGNDLILEKPLNKINFNHLEITFLNLNFLDTENFDKKPFLIKRNKLYYIFSDGISKKKYFKKEKSY